ncbi:UTRA domain-containing protein [Aquabacterium sp.]
MLDVPSGAPLLHLRQWRFAADGAATELRQAYWRADASPLLMELRW